MQTWRSPPLRWLAVPTQDPADRPTPDFLDPEQADRAAGPSYPREAGTGAAKRGPLIAAAVGVVVVMVLLYVVMARSKDDTSPSLGAALPTAVSFPTQSGGTGAAGPLEPVPLPLTGTDPSGTVPQEVTFPPGPTAPPNTHPLPPGPYTVAQPKRPGVVQVYASPDLSKPTIRLPNPVQVSPAKDPTAVGPLVLLERRDVGNGFLEVFLPTRPNGSTGYIQAADVALTAHNFHIEVRLGQFNLKAFDGSKVILDTGIAEASGATPTPGGLYYTNMLIKPPPGGPYGTYAYGLSGHSEVFQVFDGGDGQFAIHGTNEPNKIGQKVSHGCIRMRNEDIDKLAAKLPLGVPVLILP
jgi:lipoprotein-anchoring transpeptidase ErfK/SrfK